MDATTLVERRRWGISLRLLLILMIPLCAGFGMVAKKMRELDDRARLVAEIEKLGGNWSLDWQMANADPPNPSWIERLFEVDDTNIAAVWLLRYKDEGGDPASDDTLALISNVQSIKTVALYDALATEVGFASLTKLPSLKCLKLVRMRLSAAQIRELDRVSSLELLHLVFTTVDGEALERFKQSHPKCIIDTTPGPGDTPARP